MWRCKYTPRLLRYERIGLSKLWKHCTGVKYHLLRNLFNWIKKNGETLYICTVCNSVRNHCLHEASYSLIASLPILGSPKHINSFCSDKLAYQFLRIISKGIENKSVSIILPLYKTMLLLHLEYCIGVLVSPLINTMPWKNKNKKPFHWN